MRRDYLDTIICIFILDTLNEMDKKISQALLVRKKERCAQCHDCMFLRTKRKDPEGGYYHVHIHITSDHSYEEIRVDDACDCSCHKG
jgi:hypothetical protein